MKLLVEYALEIAESAKNLISSDVDVKDFINDKINFCAKNYKEYCEIWDLVDDLMK